MASGNAGTMWPTSASPGSPAVWASTGPAVNAARIYDVLLGGGASLADDQAAAGELLRLVPDAVTAAYGNRNFVRRAVRFLAGAGIRQFIDIGAGLPAQFTVHGLAQQIAPDARVLYVDRDPFVVSRMQELLACNATAAVVDHDVGDPYGILGHPTLTALVNLDEPVAVLMASVLHFIEDDADPHVIAGVFKAAMPPGSYLAVSHGTADLLSREAARGARELYRRAAGPLVLRTRTQVAAFLDGLEVTPPGVVNGSAWRPGFLAAEPRRALFYAGVGRKR